MKGGLTFQYLYNKGDFQIKVENNALSNPLYCVMILNVNPSSSDSGK